MLHSVKSGPLRPWVLLVVLQSACFSELDLDGLEGQCGPRDLSIECCLKQFPGQWERCTGSPEVVASATSVGVKTVAVGMAVVVAVQPVIGTAERRGSVLAADLLRKVEKAIEECTRKADQWVNDHHFGGRSPSRELCKQVKVGEQTTWAVYLGLFKHKEASTCLHEALSKLVPGRYLLQPRFQLDARTGKWKYLDEKKVNQIVSEQGWSGLAGTIEPDIVILDEKGIIIQVFDLKFPCPESNGARWEQYRSGPYRDRYQGDVYEEALYVTPRLVSPRHGVEPEIQKG